MNSQNQSTQEEQAALAMLDNTASMALGTRADHVTAQNAVVLLRSALVELASFRAQQATPVLENGQLESKVTDEEPQS